MRKQKLIVLLVVLGLLVPTVGAAVNAQTNSTPAPRTGESISGQDSTQADDGNYTRLYVDDRHQHLELKPGKTESFTVTVENGEDKPVDVTPQVFIPPRGERPIEKSWVSIQGGDTTLDAGEELEFTITVSVPEGTELNRYGGVIAFTNETITYPGRPEMPVHGVRLNVEVWREPTVLIHSDRHAYTQVKAGESFTREIVVENTGDQAVPVNPQLNSEDRRHPPHRRSGDQVTLDRSWLEVDSPSEIGPGETKTIKVTVSPPANAERGDYRAQLSLGLKDPARSDRSSYWQEVRLNFQVWTQPDKPFQTSFEVSDDAESIALELSAGRPYHAMTNGAPPNFDVTFVSPNGTEIDAERVRVTNRGGVNLGADRSQAATEDSTYSTGGEQQTFRYRVENPEAGSWSVKIMPENAMRFQYEIIRDESN